MIFMTLFSRFMRLKLDDELFAEFLTYFTEECYEREFEGITYQQMIDEKKSNKDKAVMEQKLRMLEHFMTEFLAEQTEEDCEINNDVEIVDRNVERFVDAVAESALVADMNLGTSTAEALAVEYLGKQFELADDENANDFPVTEELIEDVQADLDTVNEWRESLNDDFVREENLPILMQCARYAFEHDCEDEVLEKLMIGEFPIMTEESDEE